MKFNEAINTVQNLENQKQQLLQRKATLEKQIGDLDQKISMELAKHGQERQQDDNQDQDEHGRVNPGQRDHQNNNLSSAVERA